MSEQVLRNGNVMERSRTRTITQIAMLGALAGVLMNIEFPIPFLAPSFYQLDFSEIPVLVGTFAMGPVAGILIEVVKVLVHLVTMGTVTAGVGDFANFIFGCAFVVPAGSDLQTASHKEPQTCCTRNGSRNAPYNSSSLPDECICISSGIWQSIWNADRSIY